MILPDRFSLSFLLLSLHHVKSIGLFIGIQMKYHTLQLFFSLLYSLNIDIDINRNVCRHLIYMLRSSLLFGLYTYLYFDFSRLSLLYSTLLLLLCRVLSFLSFPPLSCLPAPLPPAGCSSPFSTAKVLIARLD